MWGARNVGAIALALAVSFSISACSSVIEGLEPPPLETAFHPLPPPAEPPIPIPQSRTPPAPGDARAEIASWLSANGYRDFQVAALVQLANTESGFRPCVVGPGGYHYLFQWTGRRLRQLRDFAQTSGCPQLKTQLAFTDKELRSEPSFSCFWGATSTPTAYVALRRIFGHGSC
jgi:hypothetical protein